MKFKRIKIKNLRSYKDQEIEFPEGSLLLSGDIGSGKTSILLALEYALFGLQPGQKGSSLLRNKENIGEVVLDIDLSGRLVTIERKLKRGPKGIGNEQSSLIIDGERKDSSVTEIKSKIVELLGYPQEFIRKNNVLYRHTVYTPQEQMKEIILEDPESRLNIIRNIFGIDKYKIIKNNLSILVSKLKLEFKSLQGEIKNLDSEKENLFFRKNNLILIDQKIKQNGLIYFEKNEIRKKIEFDLESIKKNLEERKSFSNEMEKTKIIISSKNDTLNSIKKEKTEILNFLKNSQYFDESLYNSILEKTKNIKLDIDELNSFYISANGKINSLEQDKIEITQKKERVFKIDICPTCLQDVSENHKHNILNETENKIVNIKKSLEALYLEKSDFENLIKRNKKELIELEEKKFNLEVIRSKQEHIKRSKAKLEEIEKLELLLDKDIILLEKHIESLKENILKYSFYENQLKNKNLELQNALMEEKSTEIIMAELKKELQMSNNEILILEKRIEEKEKSKNEMYRVSELIDWLSTQFLKLIDFAERNVLLKLRNEFSTLFRKWFLMLIPENTLDIRIDENFSPIIIQNETEMDYDFLSGGERTAVALAYRLALNQTINSLLSKIKTKGIIILDEPTDGFSEEQIMKIRDILEELNVSQLIIVSHEPKIESFVDNVFKVQKNGDISTIKTTE